MANTTRVAPDGSTITYDDGAGYPRTLTVLNISKGGIPENVAVAAANDNIEQAFSNDATPVALNNPNVGDMILGY